MPDDTTVANAGTLASTSTIAAPGTIAAPSPTTPVPGAPEKDVKTVVETAIADLEAWAAKHLFGTSISADTVILNQVNNAIGHVKTLLSGVKAP